MLKKPVLKKPPPLPLVLKLSIMISLLVIGGITVVSVFMLTKQESALSEQIADLSNAMALQLASSATEPLFADDRLALEVMAKNFSKLPRVAGVVIVDKDQQVLAQAGRQDQQQRIDDLLTYSDGNSTVIRSPDNHGVLAVTAPIQYRDAVGGHVYMMLETGTLMYAYTRNLILGLFVVGLVAILGLWMAYRISRYVSQPINRLLDVTNRIGAGQYEPDNHDRRNDEMGRLLEAINTMGKGLLQKSQVESLLNNFLAKDVADQMIRRLDTVNVGGERVEATVLFADIVGFTSLSEKLSPEEVSEFLNETFSYLSICSKMYFGTIDKFIGDCAMVVFGAPKADQDHRMHAVACAVLMQRLIHNINMLRAKQNKSQIQLRIGINTGTMLAGILGTKDKMEYTVVGDSVNLASRLCGEASAGQIITTEEVHDSLIAEEKIVASPYKKLRVRGKEEPVDTYLIEGVRKEYQLTINSLIEDVMDGMKA